MMDKLKQVKLFVATPQYGGQCYGMYMKSCLDLQSLFMQHGVEVRFSFVWNESLICRARNYLTDQFLKSGMSHLLFIDADIGFNAIDVIDMLLRDKDIISAPYPKKSINWAKIAEAARKHPDLPPEELANLVGHYVVNFEKNTKEIQINEPVEVMEAGTGFLLIKRHVFDKFKEAYPTLRFKPDYIGQQDFDPDVWMHAYWETHIDSEDSLVGGGSFRYLSEDFSFSRLIKSIGFRVFMCPWIKLTHIGTFAFTGNMPLIAQLTGHL